MDSTLQSIIRYYLSSGDFNGLPRYQIDEYDPETMEQLIRLGFVEAISNNMNPHIKFFNKVAPVEDQVKWLQNSDVCFYPTKSALIDKPKEIEKRYTALLQSGEGQFEIRYFDVRVLEQYFNNPKYFITDYGYRGSISIRDEYYEEEEHDFIQDYGMAYPGKESVFNRAIAVFIRDLSRLPEKSQMFWASHEVKEQSQWRVNGGFVKNLLYGGWVTKRWIYDALLDEQIVVNQICDAIGLKHIFSQTWKDRSCNQIEDYRTILFPTRKNYYSFVNVLEKLVDNNILTKAFTSDQKYTHSVEKNEDEGSIAVLRKWLLANGRNVDAVDNGIIAPLKELRKIRQTPAHEIIDNEYDLTVYDDQNKLIEKIFWAVHCLRIMLSTHPYAAKVAVPEYLEDVSKIVVY